jgi:hypothetical protein
VGCEFLDSREEVIGNYVFKWPIKNRLSLGFLDGFSNLIMLISLVLSYFTNINNVSKD